jgi:bifunctional DNA-binding transcriptional regulator/antitoxin component of YhaV-PrlF toxin-antitoxin module
MVKISNNNKPKAPLKLALYRTVKVYKTNQIKLDVNLLKTLGIQPGDLVEVFLDTEERAIVIKSQEADDKQTDK